MESRDINFRYFFPGEASNIFCIEYGNYFRIACYPMSVGIRRTPKRNLLLKVENVEQMLKGEVFRI